MYNMIELKEFNPPCMTETSRSRATQENENFSVLQTNNETELSDMLIMLSSRVDIVTNVEQAKTLILTDTRRDLETLISQISGQDRTVEVIRSKQTELESAVSSLMELKKQFSENTEQDGNIDISLAIREQELMILTLTREIRNLKKISDIFGSTMQEETQNTGQDNDDIVTRSREDENRVFAVISNLFPSARKNDIGIKSFYFQVQEALGIDLDDDLWVPFVWGTVYTMMNKYRQRTSQAPYTYAKYKYNAL